MKIFIDTHQLYPINNSIKLTGKQLYSRNFRQLLHNLSFYFFLTTQVLQFLFIFGTIFNNF